jgi:hypothetical protein
MPGSGKLLTLVRHSINSKEGHIFRNSIVGSIFYGKIILYSGFFHAFTYNGVFFAHLLVYLFMVFIDKNARLVCTIGYLIISEYED